MNRKIGKRLIAVVLAAVVVASLGQTVHAQPQISIQPDRASYVPGDSGTFTVTLTNNDPTTTLEIRNLTVYFPWAQYVNGNWPSGANATMNLSPWPILGSANSGRNNQAYSFSFTIPSWFSGGIFGSGSNCPGTPRTRYSTSYHGCVIVGYTAAPPQYQGQDLSIVMALPTYTPTSIISQWLPIATLVVLIVATAFLALVWTSQRRLAKK